MHGRIPKHGHRECRLIGIAVWGHANLAKGALVALLCALPLVARAAAPSGLPVDPSPAAATRSTATWVAQAAGTAPAETPAATPAEIPADTPAAPVAPTPDTPPTASAPEASASEAKKAAEPKPAGLRWSAGLALGLPAIPLESDLTGTGVALELFLDVQRDDWLGFHIAANRMTAEVDSTSLEVVALAVAYRYPFTLSERLSGHLLGGLAGLSGTLASSGGGTSLSATTLGLFAGAGLGTSWGTVQWSVEARLLYGDANFDGLTLNLGSNQLLFAGAYRF